MPYACSYTTLVALPKFISSGLYKSSVGISVSLSNNVLIIFLSFILGAASIYRISVGCPYAWYTLTVNVLLDCTIEKFGENAWTVKVNEVFCPTSNKESVGWLATTPVISPVGNNIKLGGNDPEVNLYSNGESDSAKTCNVLIVSLYIVPKSAGVIHNMLPRISKLTLNSKLNTGDTILGFPVFTTWAVKE